MAKIKSGKLKGRKEAREFVQGHSSQSKPIVSLSSNSPHFLNVNNSFIRHYFFIKIAQKNERFFIFKTSILLLYLKKKNLTQLCKTK